MKDQLLQDIDTAIQDLERIKADAKHEALEDILIDVEETAKFLHVSVNHISNQFINQ